MAAFPRLSVRMLIHFPSPRRIQGSTSTGVFEGGCRTSTQASLGFPFHFSLPNTSEQPLFAISTQMSCTLSTDQKYCRQTGTRQTLKAGNLARRKKPPNSDSFLRERERGRETNVGKLIIGKLIHRLYVCSVARVESLQN